MTGPTTTPDPTIADILASLLTDFGTKPKKDPAKPAKPASAVAPVRSIAQALNETRTGYLAWEPIGRAIFIRQQHCQCCGAITSFVENELYLLKHGKSQSRWYRPEGHEAGFFRRELPLEVNRILDPQLVTACPQCLDDSTLDKLVLAVNTPQLAWDF